MPRTLGIIGGIGPESTIAYYRLGVEAFRKRNIEPSIIINSIAMNKMQELVAGGKRTQLVEYLSQEVRKLADAGANVALLAANTPHIVFDELRAQASISLVSIVQAACAEANSRGLTRLGLFGTRFTMQGRFYPDVFAPAGIALISPNDSEQAFIHDTYMTELLQGRFLPATRNRLLAIVDRLRQDEAIQGLVLGGTELPFILRGETHNGIPLLDTAKIHVEYAMLQLLSH